MFVSSARCVRSIPFAFYRSGTSRGIYLRESDVSAVVGDDKSSRNALFGKIMGSGHPQQLEGFGGGIGPTSKLVVVGIGKDNGSVTYEFRQCKVGEPGVDESHGDCGNMIAAVAPFALESGLVSSGDMKGKCVVPITSLVTGAEYTAEVPLTIAGDVEYSGSFEVPGVPTAGAPIVISTLGVAGSQTGSLLPTGSATDSYDLGEGLGFVDVSVVDFARCLIMFDGEQLFPIFGIANLEAAMADLETLRMNKHFHDALERVRRAVSVQVGMGDCTATGQDAPKVAILGPCSSLPEGYDGHLRSLYYVNPMRSEMHPTYAMTAAQAVGAACLVKDSIAWRLNAPLGSDLSGKSDFSLMIRHAKGELPVIVGAESGSDNASNKSLYPHGFPNAGKYATTVRPIAQGDYFLH